MAVAYYVGIPKAGKTTLAIAHGRACSVARSAPLLIIDGEGDARLEGVPTADSVAGVFDLLDHHGIAVWTPPRKGTKTELPKLADTIERVGGLVVVFDGAHVALNGHTAPDDPWVRVQRVHRHAKLDLLFTTHHYTGDVAQVVQSCAPTLYVFRMTAPAALRSLEQSFGLDPEMVRALEIGRYVRIEQGFST